MPKYGNGDDDISEHIDDASVANGKRDVKKYQECVSTCSRDDVSIGDVGNDVGVYKGLGIVDGFNNRFGMSASGTFSVSTCIPSFFEAF